MGRQQTALVVTLCALASLNTFVIGQHSYALVAIVWGLTAGIIALLLRK